MLTREQALSLKKGDKLYSNAVWFAGKDGTDVPAVATVQAPPKVVKGQPLLLAVVREYGAFAKGNIGEDGFHLWRTTKDKQPEDENVLPKDLATGARRISLRRPTAPVQKEVEVLPEAPARIARTRQAPAPPAVAPPRIARKRSIAVSDAEDSASREALARLFE